MALEKAVAAAAKLSALGDTSPELASVARAAAQIVDEVLEDARKAVEVAKAETAEAEARVAEFGTAISETVVQRDEAEIAKANLELENSALRIKSLHIEREAQVKRQYIAKAEQDDIEKAEEAQDALTTAATIATIVYLHKSVRHAVTRKSFIDERRKSGPWECLTREGRVILAETRADVVNIAMRLAVDACLKSVPAEDDPDMTSHLDGKKKPHMFPETGADMGSNDSYDSKSATSKRVPVAKRASGKRTPKWKR